MIILLKFERKTVEILRLHHTLEAEYSDNCPSRGLGIHRHLSLRLQRCCLGKYCYSLLMNWGKQACERLGRLPKASELVIIQDPEPLS